MSIRKQYDTDLEALKAALVEMGSNSAEAVEAALEALCTADAEAAQKIVKGDSRINNMERDIEHRCMTLLLRQQPVAGDLRRISTAMKVVTDIERIGDHASDIAEIIPHLVTVRKEGDPAVSQAIAMGRKAYQMIQDAMAALTAEDELAAHKVIAADDAVDFDFNAIKHTLAQEIAADPAKVDAALDLLMVIKYLERIGDQAADIAEIILRLRGQAYIKPLVHLPQMAARAIEMVTGSIDAFVRKDLEKTKSVFELDDLVDELFRIVKNELVELIHKDASCSEQAVDLLMIAKYFERIGDHAQNIAEWVEFSLTGVHKNGEKQ